MIKLKLNNDTYRIVADNYCWLLQRKAVSKSSATKKEGWCNEVYHRDLTVIAKWLVDRGVKDVFESLTSLDQINVVANKIGEEFLSQLQARRFKAKDST